MALIRCPKCNKVTNKPEIKTWVIILFMVTVIFIPIGLLLLMYLNDEKKRIVCKHCDYNWLTT